MELTKNDLEFVVRRLPKDIRELLSKYHGKLFVGGGFIRSVIAGEEVSDIDLFGDSEATLKKAANELKASRMKTGTDTRNYVTKNAITVLSANKSVIQFITRWVFDDMQSVVDSFDFTICQAVIVRTGGETHDRWASVIGDSYYSDLAARRLVYTHPERDEEAGGSMLRVIKYVKRGYVIQVDSLAGVVSRMMASVKFDRINVNDETAVTFVLNGLLQEVDPSIAVDGLDAIDEEIKE